MIKTEICIIGGGLAGLLTAKLLGQAGINLVLIEQTPLEIKKTKPSGRTSALMQGSLDVLKEAGVWESVKDFCAPLEKIKIIDGNVETAFSADEIGLPYFGQNVPNEALKQAVLKDLKEMSNVTLIDENGIWDFEERDPFIYIRLNDDRDVRAKLLIGADGKNSMVRQIAGIKTIKTGYDQSAITCLINHSRSHENTSAEFHKPGGPFTLVPCRGNQSAVVWCERVDTSEELIKLKKSDFEQALQDMTQNILGDITLETSPESWRLKGMVARKLVAHRLVLIAEAAHALHPIGAQGLNLSLRDIKALANLVITQHQLGLDIGDLNLLKKYKSQRRSDTFSRFLGVGGLCTLTSKKSKGLQRLRQAGLKLMNRSPFLRKQAMAFGLGAKAA